MKCFENYKSSILKGAGNEAVNYVDSKTIEYYQKVLDNCKTLDSTEISQLGIMDKLMVLTVKHKTSSEDILNFSGKELFIYAVDAEMIGKNSVQTTEIGDVKITNKTASSKVMSQGQAAPFGFDFNKESNSWKIDLTSVFTPTETAFSQMAKNSGYSEDEYLEVLIGMISTESELNDIWKRIER